MDLMGSVVTLSLPQIPHHAFVPGTSILEGQKEGNTVRCLKEVPVLYQRKQTAFSGSQPETPEYLGQRMENWDEVGKGSRIWLFGCRGIEVSKDLA